MKTENLQEWIGKTEERSDLLNAFPANAMAATLNHEQLDYSENKNLPPLWHWLYFLPIFKLSKACLLYTSPSPRDKRQSRMPSSA